MSNKSGQLTVVISELEIVKFDLLWYRRAELARAIARAWVRESLVSLDREMITPRKTDSHP